jgi:drug/metabolite transporter (DMT)-like permease
MKETLKGAFFVIGAMLIFALFGVALRLIDLPSIVFVFFMFLISGLVLFGYTYYKDRKIPAMKNFIWLLILLGGLNILNNFFYFQAFKLTTISNAVLTHYIAPIFVALFAPLLLKEKIEKITIIALVFSIVGIYLVVSNDLSFYGEDFAGIMYGVGSGIMYAFVIILVKHLSNKISALTINTYQSISGAVLLLPYILILGPPIQFKTLSLLVLFALVFGILATLMYMFGLKRIKSQHAATLSYIEPTAAIAYGFLFFSEVPTLNTLLGGGIILVGSYLIIKREK